MAASKIALHPNIVVEQTMGSPRQKKYSVIDLFTCARQFLVYNSSIWNLARALNERFFYAKVNGSWQLPPQPVEGKWEELATLVHPLLVDSLHKFTPYAREEIPLLYTGRKRSIYLRAEVDLQCKPLTAADFMLNIFGKTENLDSTVKKQEDIVMRVIQARGARYNLELGRYLKKIEHQVYKDIDNMFAKETGLSYKYKTIIKGMNSETTAKHVCWKWDHFDNPVFIGVDAKRYDQCVSVASLIFEHLIYPKYFKNKRHRKTLKWLLSAQIKNKGKGFCDDGKIKYEHLGGRCSGDMNTGLGNSVQMASMLFGYMRSLGITKYAVICNGDDAGIIVERELCDRVLNGIEQYFLELGFRLEVEEPVYQLEEISFCQTKPVWDGKSYRMIRDINVSASKDALSITKFQSIKDWVYYMDSVGQGGLSMTAGMPMLQEYYSAMIRVAKENCPSKFNMSKRKPQLMDRQTGLWHLSNGMNRKYTEVTQEARVSFYEAFGITPIVQMEMEEKYRNVKLEWNGADYMGSIKRLTF